jgi:hypothetical protein
MAAGNINQPQLALGPVEKVLAFNVKTTITLIPAVPPNPAYFSSVGVILDLHNYPVPGSKSETALPTDPAGLPLIFKWPNPQGAPFSKIPPNVDPTNVNTLGYSKQEYVFGDLDEGSLVTVGPSLPKITLLKNGGAQFWVGSVGAVSQGTGPYLGAKGMAAYDGGAYFPVWPSNPQEVLKLLTAGFEAWVATYFKLVLKQDEA